MRTLADVSLDSPASRGPLETTLRFIPTSPVQDAFSVPRAEGRGPRTEDRGHLVTPYLFIRSYSVDRSMPRLVAASFTLPPVRRRVASMTSCSSSSSDTLSGTCQPLEGRGDGRRKAKSSSVSTVPFAVTMARSIAFSSSRTLPGQS